MSENAAPASAADGETLSPANPISVPETQPGASEFTPEQMRSALAQLFNDLNQVLRRHGVENTEIIAFTTALIETKTIDGSPPIVLHPHPDLSNSHEAVNEIDDESAHFAEVDELEGAIGQVLFIRRLFSATQLDCLPPKQIRWTQDGPLCR